SAGQVASLMRIVPAMTAAAKRGAGPNSPKLTAEVSIAATQPAPIKRSACRLEVGSVTSESRRTPRRISARVAAMATPEVSRGTDRADRRLAGARRRDLGPVDQHDVDRLRRLGDVEDRVSHPVDAGDVLAVELDLFPQRAAGALHDVALDRVLEPFGVDDQAA